MAATPWTPPAQLVAALKKAQKECLAIRPALEYWDELAKTVPEIMEAVTAMWAKYEHIIKQCECGLQYQSA